MTSQQINELLAGLLRKTQEDKAVWMSGSARNQFTIQFEKGAITLTRYRREVKGPLIIDFNILNSKGEAIVAVKMKENDAEFARYHDLFETIKAKYFKIDETIDDIFKAINGDDKIGRDTTNDLPF